MVTERSLESGSAVDQALELPLEAGSAVIAMDSEHRVVFWNRGAESLFGRPAAEAVGRRCHELLEGRDIFDNRICHAGCTPLTMLRRGEGVRCFEMRLVSNGEKKALMVTTFRAPENRDTHPYLVHVVTRLLELGRLVSAPDLNGVPDGQCLTKRESDILGLFATGLQNKEIAARLGISVATVRNHVNHILAKLDVHSKLEAACFALSNGWIAADSSARMSTRDRSPVDPRSCRKPESVSRRRCPGTRNGRSAL